MLLFSHPSNEVGSMSEIQEAGDIANVLDANTNYALLALLGNWVFADNPYVLEVIYSATAEEDPNTNLVELLGPNGTFCDTGKYSHIPFREQLEHIGRTMADKTRGRRITHLGYRITVTDQTNRIFDLMFAV